ncbi:phosphate transporter [Candidatus Vecturithrix granuli]|uniref:Phosphate transporter n=1 Tax=Vecturithrix granuli TaxID=1499967 RepID=A0A081BW00_VECG1|nr:phosphate transporter [Candidatus Vecturithrix granuli]
MFRLLSGVFLGWSLGANDAANVFGTAVASRMIKFSVAATIIAIFVVLGAVLQGAGGMKTLGGLTSQDLNSAFISSFAAAVTVTIMTYLSLPVSTSQSVVGAILGIGLALHQDINWEGLQKVVFCWVGNPLGAMFISFSLYKLFRYILGKVKLNILLLNTIIKWGLLVSGAYGAYALGGNSVANVTGVFARAGLITVRWATIIGSLSIALGAITYSKRVMMTVGSGLVALDGFSAFVAVLSEAITIHIYVAIGVPVSTSQAIVGAVLGIGIAVGARSVNNRTLINIVLGWLATPLIAGIVAAIMIKLWGAFLL